MIKNENEDITDNELYFLVKQAKTLLNDNNQIILKYDDNIILKKFNNPEIYLELKRAIFKINSLLDIFNNNNNDINNSKEKENLINNLLYSNNELNNNISNDNNIIIDLGNIFHSKKKNTIDSNKNNKCSLEVNENVKQYKIKKFKNTNKFINKKRNIFMTSDKISRYRGVSLNKNKWQAYIWMNNKNTYLGTYSSEKIAAIIYDVMAIKKNGQKAKTNFKYNSKEIKKIDKINIDINYLLEMVSKIYN